MVGLDVAVPDACIGVCVQLPKHQEKLLDFIIRHEVDVATSPFNGLHLDLDGVVFSLHDPLQHIQVLFYVFLHVNNEVVEVTAKPSELYTGAADCCAVFDAEHVPAWLAYQTYVSLLFHLLIRVLPWHLYIVVLSVIILRRQVAHSEIQARVKLGQVF